MNCGADIVAVTAWMSTEMGKLQGLIQETPVTEPNSIKTNGIHTSGVTEGLAKSTTG